MWNKKIKKTIFTLNVNGYSPEITRITYPFLEQYADKIGADFHIIDKRSFPEMPVTYEKMQIYTLGQELENDWNIYIDSDALVHPETIDFTELVRKDTVIHNGVDMASIRWKYDSIFRRDGRHIGSCNWFTIASDWCLDLWHPLDISLSEALHNIQPTVREGLAGIQAEHLIDDYTLSRNVARFGLKLVTAIDLQIQNKLPEANFFYHQYTIPTDRKVKELKKMVEKWKEGN